MSSRDEYSSDEEDIYDSGKGSQVLLGFVDGAITNDDLPTIEDTFIGGQPVWLHPDSKPPESYLICDHCRQKLALLVQAFAPIDGKIYDRVIYTFGCKTSTCAKQKGSVKVIRGINKSPQTVKRIKEEIEEANAKLVDEKLRLDNVKKLNEEMTKNLFKRDESGVFSANPFGGNPFEKTEVSKEKEVPKEKGVPKEKEVPSPQTYAQAASKNAPKSKKKKTLDEKLPEYNGSFVYVEPEKFKKDKSSDAELEKYRHLIDQDEDDLMVEGSSRRGSQSSAVLDPQTQKISNMLDDKYFASFSSTVKHNPGQVLRYDLNGKPLLYSGKDEVAKKFLLTPANIPKPGFNPSSERRFEFQLMPKAIMDLEGLDDKDKVDIKDILNGMSWGTIIVCTDVEDYIPEEQFDENKVGYIEEWCGVQWEESV
ncbi:hypothetical protein KGF56_000710 [Candida oxycetoniae]|uniref:Programmed cell death protein 2 C-terminal domain-containing protein n=1 Tax=Candida oxycetoniae TaxID=497107 RepID=A0AAI9WZU5_9ASCO|nr:uncharacterized protein KGF56_000710 [Candida oxycetoniae]KAI3406578.2 hypothetical protein KGF56_000710 [Candida oxycetoniae]